MAQVTAQLNNLRLAPRKVRAVSNLIKGKNAFDALNQLETVIKRPSLPLIKLLKSAMANAENNHDMVKENLYIKSVEVNEGVKLKRFKPKGFGRVSPIEKKASHINLILAEKVIGLRRTPVDKKTKEEKTNMSDSTKFLDRPKHGQETTPIIVEERQETKKPLDSARSKPEVKTELGKKEGVFSNIGKKIFRRKVI